MASEPVGLYVLESASTFPDALMPYNDDAALGAFRRAIAAEVASGLDLFTGDMLRVGMNDVITNDNATSGPIQWNFSHVVRAIEAVQQTNAGVRPAGTRDLLTLQILGIPPAIAMAQIPLDQQVVDAEGFTVPLPWSQAAGSVASSMYTALANTPIVDYSQPGNPTVLLKDHPTLTTVVSAPIGARGFRSEQFTGGLLTQTLPGYDRDLYAISLLHSAKAVTEAFPNDFSYMQWFGFNDGKNSLYNGESLNTRINRDFSEAFNGVGQPSFGVFRENLGEKGPSASTAHLLVDFEIPGSVYNDPQSNVLFQALSTWISPFPTTEVNRFEQTNSGSPANGMMVGYSEFDARYFEHYSPDFELTTANIRKRFADDPNAAADPDLDILPWEAVDTDAEVEAIRQTLRGLLADWNVYLVGGPKPAVDFATVPQGSSVNIPVLDNDTPPPGVSPWDNTIAGVLQLDALQFTISSVTQGGNGSVTISADKRSVLYTPAPNFSGNDTFSYTISDGAAGVATTSVYVTVSPSSNHPPIALNDSFSVNEDSAANSLAVLTNDSDQDAGQSISVVSVSSAAHGTLAIVGSGTGVTYKPNPNFNGVDTFAYTISDGQGGMATASVSVTVAPRLSSWNNVPTNPLPSGVQHLTFFSESMQTNVGFNIYLPPSYATSQTQEFPVVYWLHGIGGNENTGVSVVTAALSNGINTGAVPPMIVVFVNGTAPLAPLLDGPDADNDPDDGGKVGTFYTDSFDGNIKGETAIINELLPHIDENFRTFNSREGRSLEGFSMGGYGALRLAAKFPELFSSVVTMGGALLSADSLAIRNPAEYVAIFGGNSTYAASTNPRSLIVSNRTNLLAYGVDYMQRVGAGDPTATPPIAGDPTRPDNVEVRNLLIANGIPNDYAERVGIIHSSTRYYNDWLGASTFEFHAKAFSSRLSSSIPDQTATRLSPFSFTVPATSFLHPAGRSLSYSASLADGTTLPNWLTFDSNTRTLQGIPPAEQLSPLTIRVTATDNHTTGLFPVDKDAAFDDFAINFISVNVSPTAQAGGPYVTDEGIGVTLSGSGLDPDAGTILSYEWDLDYDGVTFQVDATTAGPSVSYPDGPMVKTVALRVTDNGLPPQTSPIVTTTVTVNNVVPTVDRVNASLNGSLNVLLTNTGTWNDVPADTVTLGASLGSVVKNTNGTWSWSYTPTMAVVNQVVTITAEDEDGGMSSTTFTITVTGAVAGVVNRRLFYNNATGSLFGNGSGNPLNAIDTSKVAVLPGQTAGVASYTNYVRGLNGLIVDIDNLPGVPTAADFEFATWDGINAGNFQPAVAVPTVEVFGNGGQAGADRVKLTFADNAIRNTWLRITVLANATTGLLVNDVFYFGSAVGEMNVGNLSGPPILLRTNATDTGTIRQNQSPNTNSVDLSNLYDLNKDGRVNATDTGLVRQNQSPTGSIAMFTAPASLELARTRYETDVIMSDVAWLEELDSLFSMRTRRRIL